MDKPFWFLAAVSASQPEIIMRATTSEDIIKRLNKIILRCTLNQFLQTLNGYTLTEDKNAPTVVSFFSGGGGLDLGLSLAGFRTAYASDLEKQHCETLQNNFPNAVIEAADINNSTGDHIRQITGINQFDLMAGGPPCQAFSILGQRKACADPRGMLVYQYVRMLNELQPRAFVFENVPGLLTVNGGQDWEEFLQYLEENTKYHFHYKVMNSADYGCPQIRKRVIIVGFKEDIPFEFPKPTHFEKPKDGQAGWVKSRFAFEDLEGVPNHVIRAHCDRVRNRYDKVKPGERDHTDHTDRVHPDRPSGTVLVGSRGGGGRPFIHPFDPRHITVREAARLQTFPDWYEFANTTTWQYRAVGNAVPVLMAKAIGKAIKKALGY